MSPSGSNTKSKRLYERVSAPVVGLVDVYREESGKRKYVGPSLLEDISQGGLGIRMDGYIPAGTLLHLSNRFVTYSARVCHCTPSEVGFRLGLRFLTPQTELSAGVVPAPKSK